MHATTLGGVLPVLIVRLLVSQHKHVLKMIHHHVDIVHCLCLKAVMMTHLVSCVADIRLIKGIARPANIREQPESALWRVCTGDRVSAPQMASHVENLLARAAKESEGCKSALDANTCSQEDKDASITAPPSLLPIPWHIRSGGRHWQSSTCKS